MLVKTISFEHSPEQAAIASITVAVRLYRQGQMVDGVSIGTWDREQGRVWDAGTYLVAEPNVEADEVGIDAHNTRVGDNYIVLDGVRLAIPVAGANEWSGEVRYSLGDGFPWVLAAIGLAAAVVGLVAVAAKRR